MKKKLNNNIEIYNYLNITNRQLGKMYKYTGTNCLSSDFDVNENAIKERIILNEMQNENIFPPFVNEEKKNIKKCLKNSIKNIQKIKKYAKNAGFLQKYSNEFTKKFGLYLDLRHELSHIFLKDFESQDCDEVEIYRQLFNLDPVFGALTDSLFDAKPDFDDLLSGLEEKYQKSYLEKLQELEKKNEKRKKKAAKKILEEEALKSAKKSKKINAMKAKKDEKTAKMAQKSQNLKDAQKVRAQNKEKLLEQKTKVSKDRTK